MSRNVKFDKQADTLNVRMSRLQVIVNSYHFRSGKASKTDLSHSSDRILKTALLCTRRLRLGNDGDQMIGNHYLFNGKTGKIGEKLLYHGYLVGLRRDQG